MEVIKNKNNIWLTISLYIAIFFSSINGLTLFGISFNKICLIPLEIYAIFYLARHTKITLTSPFKLLISSYFVIIISSLFGMILRGYSDFDEYNERLIFNVVQYLFIYMPIAVFVFGYEEKKELFNKFISIFIKVCRFHALFVLFQFIIWNMFSVDIADELLNGIFNGFFGEYKNHTVWNGTTEFLRVTGLNNDAAHLSLILVIGFCFDKRIGFKFLYFITTIFANSRSGILVMMIVLLFSIIMYVIKNRNNLTLRVVMLAIFLPVIFGLSIIVLYENVPSFSRYCDLFIERFKSIGDSESDKYYGTSRHTMYPLYAIYSWSSDLNFIEKIIGVGIRTEGLVFNHSDYISSLMIFNSTMLESAWTIECDFASILLGNGLLGLLLYAVIIKKFIFSNNKYVCEMGIALLVFSFVYDVYTTTVVQLILIFFLATNQEKVESVYESENNFVYLY